MGSLAILAVDVAREGKINETDFLPLFVFVFTCSLFLPRPVTLLTHPERNGGRPEGKGAEKETSSVK